MALALCMSYVMDMTNAMKAIMDRVKPANARIERMFRGLVKDDIISAMMENAAYMKVA